MWNFGTPSLSGIIETLGSEDCALEKVLLEPALPQALRNSLAELQAFIQRDDIFEDLLNWVFTDCHKDVESFSKLTYNALSIFTTPSQQFQKLVYNHQLFIPRLKSFMESSKTGELPDPLSCGHFQNIIEHYSRYSNGQLLGELTELPSFLIHNMSVLSLRELFMNLTTDFSSNFPLTQENVIELSKETIGQTGYFVTTAIKTVFEKEPDALIQLFQNKEVVTNLLNAAENANPLVSTEVYRLLSLIYSHCTNKEELKPIVDEYAAKFIEVKTVSCSTAQALHFFKVMNDDIFQTIFTKPVNTFVNESIIEVLTSMKPTERDVHFKAVQAPQRLQDARYETRANDQLFKLYDLIKETYNSDPDLQIEFPGNWTNLAKNIEETEQKEDKPYGNWNEELSYYSNSSSNELHNTSSDEDEEDEEDDDANEYDDTDEEDKEEVDKISEPEESKPLQNADTNSKDRIQENGEDQENEQQPSKDENEHAEDNSQENEQQQDNDKNEHAEDNSQENKQPEVSQENDQQQTTDETEKDRITEDSDGTK